jgi:hypothetical protein
MILLTDTDAARTDQHINILRAPHHRFNRTDVVGHDTQRNRYSARSGDRCHQHWRVHVSQSFTIHDSFGAFDRHQFVARNQYANSRSAVYHYMCLTQRCQECHRCGINQRAAGQGKVTWHQVTTGWPHMSVDVTIGIDRCHASGARDMLLSYYTVSASRHRCTSCHLPGNARWQRGWQRITSSTLASNR